MRSAAAQRPVSTLAPFRLGILTIANEARQVEFGYLRTSLELTAGNLSQHLGVLESAGLISIEKGYAGKRARTWVSLTKAGRAALVEEVKQLKLLISQIERTTSKCPTDCEARRMVQNKRAFVPFGPLTHLGWRRSPGPPCHYGLTNVGRGASNRPAVG